MVVGPMLLMTGIVGLVNVSIAALAVMLRVRTNSADAIMWALVGVQVMLLAGVLAGSAVSQGGIQSTAEAFGLLVHGMVILFAGVALTCIATGPHDP